MEGEKKDTQISNLPEMKQSGSEILKDSAKVLSSSLFTMVVMKVMHVV